MKRVFAAIVPGEAAVRAISEHIGALRVTFPATRANWVAEENLHLTIHFAGEIDEVRLTALQANLDAVANHTPAFRASLGAAGSFADRRLGRSVLWIGLKETSGAEGTIARAASELKALEGGRSPRFVPHLTIARVREPFEPRLLELHQGRELSLAEFEVNSFVIYESRLTRTGPIYSVLSTHVLRGDPR